MRRVFKIVVFIFYSMILQSVLFFGQFSSFGILLYLSLFLSCIAVYLVASVLQFCQMRRWIGLPSHLAA